MCKVNQGPCGVRVYGAVPVYPPMLGAFPKVVAISPVVPPFPFILCSGNAGLVYVHGILVMKQAPIVLIATASMSHTQSSVLRPQVSPHSRRMGCTRYAPIAYLDSLFPARQSHSSCLDSSHSASTSLVLLTSPTFEPFIGMFHFTFVSPYVTLMTAVAMP